MDKKALITGGFVFLIAQAFINLGIFVTFPQMASYAASKDSIQQLLQQVSIIQKDVSDIKNYLMSNKR